MEALLEEVNLQLRTLPDRLKILRSKKGPPKRPSSIIDVNDADADYNYGETLRHLACSLKSGESSDTLQHGFDVYTSAFWQLPAFCDGGIVINHEVVKDRLVALQQHRAVTQKYTDDIWECPEISRWVSSLGPPVVLLQGMSQSLERVETFGVLVVEHLQKTSPVLHLLSPLPADVYQNAPATFRGNEVLRQLTVQCLRMVSLDQERIPNDPKLLAYVTSHFKSGQVEDWFSVMERILRFSICPVLIVLNTEVLRGKFRDASSWPARFSRLCQLLGASGITIRVMMISGRQISPETYDDIPVVGVMSDSVQLRRAAREYTSELSTTVLTSTKFPGDREGGLGKLPLILAREDHTDDQSTPVHKTLDRYSMVNIGPNARNPPQSDYIDRFDGQFQGAGPGLLDESANKWFHRLESQTHDVLYNYKNYEPGSFQPLKIAVLDTGFAYTEAADKKALKPYKQRIAKFVNFVQDGQGDATAMCDPSGHGTAVAVQLLKTSRTAVLYICRIAETGLNATPPVPDKAAVGRAIRRAAAPPGKAGETAGGWGVDIINMSFGWPHDDDDDVRAALRYARDMGVHLLASTSNEGLLGPPRDIMYPARDQNVIAVDAADGLGEYAPTSASSLSGAGGWDRRFSALGVGLSSPHVNRLWTGSSFACPVAAGIVALIMEFARQPPLRQSQTVQSHLRTMSGITSVLRMMSEKKGPGEFRFLLPWNVLGRPGEQRDQTSYRIVSELRKEFGYSIGTEIYPLRRPGD